MEQGDISMQCKKVKLTWGAWHGDLPLTIHFPVSWDVSVIENGELPYLSIDDINDRIYHPSGCPGLPQMAKGKNTAGILIDDMTRPTPTDILLPFMIKAIEAGGISRSNITVFIAGGAHRETSSDRIRKKIGPLLAGDLKVVHHDCEENLAYLGITKKGTPIYINKTFLECDIKIGCGTILPHPIAGFSGGSKIAIPGICGKTTIRHLHDYAQCYQPDYHRGPGKNLGKTQTDFRQEIDEICDIMGLDFLVNVVLNHKREVLDLFAGNWEEVYRLGVKTVRKYFMVRPVPSDVVVANTYPFDTDMQYMLRGFWPLFSEKHNPIKVAVGFGGEGMAAFCSKNGSAPLSSRLLNRLKSFKTKHVPNDIKIGINILRKIIQKKRLQYLIFCPSIKHHELKSVLPKSMCFDKWGDVLAEITKRNPRKQRISVSVYPYAPLQFPGRSDDSSV